MNPSYLTNDTGITTYGGLYKGIIIDTNSELGLVKCFVPEIYGYDINDIVSLDQLIPSFVYKFPGKNIQSNLDRKTLDQIKNIPWARISGPIIGDCSPGRYIPEIDAATVGDGTNPLKLITPGSVESAKAKSYKQNPPKGSSGLENMLPKRNPYEYAFGPENFDNLPKGTFGIPNIGAQVWVMFVRGDHNFPVIMGSANSTLEYSQINYDAR
jgi:hypothetical protein